jgi:hypothetical protein
MATNNSMILKTMNVIFWVIFIGLCIKTGSILYSYFVSMAINPVASHNLYMGLNLSELYNYSITHYSVIVFMLILLTGLKAYIGYWIVKIFLELRIEKPFSEVINNMIIKIGKIALYAGLLAIIAQTYSEWLMKKNLAVPINWAYGEILFFAGVIYFIAQVYRKGTEIQAEGELTV